jgi:hypothetical protein
LEEKKKISLIQEEDTRVKKKKKKSTFFFSLAQFHQKENLKKKGKWNVFLDFSIAII